MVGSDEGKEELTTTRSAPLCRRCGVEIAPAKHPVLGTVYVDIAKPDLHISERARCVESEFMILHEPDPEGYVERECPTCGAQPGEPCFNLIRPGITNKYPHDDRL